MVRRSMVGKGSELRGNWWREDRAVWVVEEVNDNLIGYNKKT